MINSTRLKKYVMTVAATFAVVLGVAAFVPGTALAAGPLDPAIGAVCEGVNKSGSNCQEGSDDLTQVMRTVLTIMSIVAGTLAVIMIVFSGMRYVTSGGDSNGVAAAKRTLIYAIVGLVVVALAQFIVQFVLAKTPS